MASTYIHLPHHAHTSRMIQAFARVLGVPMKKSLFELDRKKGLVMRPDAPSGPDNPWRWEEPEDFCLASPLSNTKSGTNTSALKLIFKDPIGQERCWLWCVDTEWESSRLLFTDSEALAVAVGERLVQLFGGMLQDYNDDARTCHRVSNGSALFPAPSSKHRNQVLSNTYRGADERWYAFQNALEKTAPLCAADIRAAESRAFYGIQEHTQRLIDYLDVQAVARRLSVATDVGQLPARAGLRF